MGYINEKNNLCAFLQYANFCIHEFPKIQATIGNLYG